MNLTLKRGKLALAFTVLASASMGIVMVLFPAEVTTGSPLNAQAILPQLPAPFATPASEGWIQSVNSSNIRWVAENGHNGNDGATQGTAWRTIDHAVNQRQNWDLLHIVTSSTPYTANVVLYNIPNETPVKPRIIRGVNAAGQLAQPQDRPHIIPFDYTKSEQRPFTVSAQYWILEGLFVDCNQAQPQLHGKGMTGIYLVSNPVIPVDHVAIQHSTVRN
jgi:hypothetical protein